MVMPKRYIEATKAINILSLFYNYTDAERYDLSLAISAVPTADVVERKKGKWIQRSDSPYYYECSNCHRVISAVSVDQIEKFHAFCGTCGSDMREDGEDE